MRRNLTHRSANRHGVIVSPSSRESWCRRHLEPLHHRFIRENCCATVSRGLERSHRRRLDENPCVSDDGWPVSIIRLVIHGCRVAHITPSSRALSFFPSPLLLTPRAPNLKSFLAPAAPNPPSLCAFPQIDDCWRCAGTDWRQDRQRLADCGKGGPMYVVTDSSDRDPVNPAPGTLRYGAIQEGPLWIVFATDMSIRLNEELLVNSYKTIDGRGANVHIAGGACITLQYVSNIIIHNLHIHDCVPAGNANVCSSPTHYGWRTRSDGDGISL
ncbi:hypothetical protein GUJ93_ZPchr0016g2586 [Zizania palustris]|nr:hypothetical protein GUJ93_ZPchr0016g2586 [Zizania palustris]